VVAPVLAGLDKFFEPLVDWDRYLAPAATDVLPVAGHTLMPWPWPGWPRRTPPTRTPPRPRR
jgi:hypothetical protein